MSGPEEAAVQITVEEPDEDMEWFNAHDPHCEVCDGLAFVTDPATGRRVRCPA